MKIERELVKRFHRELNSTMATLGQKYGLHFTEKGLRFSPDRITGRLEFIAIGAEAKPAHPWVNERGAEATGFKVGSKVKLPVHTGQTVYEITAYTSRGSVSLKRLPDGKKFRAGPAQVAQFVAADAASKKEPGTKCPKCGKMELRQAGFRRLGPECVEITYKCSCGYTDTDVMD